MYIGKPTFVTVSILVGPNDKAVLLYEGEWESWKPHPEGIVVKIGDKFLLNGKTEVSEEVWNSLFAGGSPQILLNNSIEKNTGRYQGGFDSWSATPTGIIIRNVNSFYFVPLEFE